MTVPTQQQPAQKELARRYDEATRRATSLVRREYPGLVGVFLQGSVARGEPGPYSDIDIVGVTLTRKKPAEFSYYDGDIYVPVGFVSIADLEKEFRDPQNFFWARGSAKTSSRILYDPKGILRRFTVRWKKTKPSHELLEKALWDEYHHMIEYSGKLRNGWLRHDEYLTRYAARVIAHHVENAVEALNDLSIISENHVWHQVMEAKRKPEHLETDYPLALGIRGTADTSRVYRSALRLCKETLRLIRREFKEKARHERFRVILAEPLEKHGL